MYGLFPIPLTCWYHTALNNIALYYYQDFFFNIFIDYAITVVPFPPLTPLHPAHPLPPTFPPL